MPSDLNPQMARGAAELAALERGWGSWQQKARAVVRRAGHNRGAARDALIELFEGESCAMSVREIEERLQFRRPVGRASMYRALDLLFELKLIVRVEVGDGVVRYERSQDTHDEHHHHLICDRCGLLTPFDDDELEQAIHNLSGRHGFDTKGHEVILRGTCLECL